MTMTDNEKILAFRAQEIEIQEAETEVNRCKDLLTRAKKVFDTRVAELRSSIRRTDEEDDQTEIEFDENAAAEETTDPPPAADGVLPENPSTADPADQDRFQESSDLTLPENPDRKAEDDFEVVDDSDEEGPKLTEEMEAAAVRTSRIAGKGGHLNAG